jgi:hypothetical protein
MITARVLPDAEWPRLLTECEGPAIDQLRQTGFPDPQHLRINVVEQDGRIVGYWFIFATIHAEPAWIAPEARKHPGIVRSLIEQTIQTLQDEGVTMAFCVVADVDLLENAPLVRRLGFTRAPGELYFVTVPPKE